MTILAVTVPGLEVILSRRSVAPGDNRFVGVGLVREFVISPFMTYITSHQSTPRSTVYKVVLVCQSPAAFLSRLPGKHDAQLQIDNCQWIRPFSIVNQ